MRWRQTISLIIEFGDDAMTLQEILVGESKNVEFKEKLPERSINYMKSVIAFANGMGGKNYIWDCR